MEAAPAPIPVADCTGGYLSLTFYAYVSEFDRLTAQPKGAEVKWRGAVCHSFCWFFKVLNHLWERASLDPFLFCSAHVLCMAFSSPCIFAEMSLETNTLPTCCMNILERHLCWIEPLLLGPLPVTQLPSAKRVVEGSRNWKERTNANPDQKFSTGQELTKLRSGTDAWRWLCSLFFPLQVLSWFSTSWCV